MLLKPTNQPKFFIQIIMIQFLCYPTTVKTAYWSKIVINTIALNAVKE